MFTDLNLFQFLDEGFSIIHPKSLPDSIHDALFAGAVKQYQQQNSVNSLQTNLDHISDRLDVMLPEVNHVLQCPELTSALNLILGEDHFRYPHSFIHKSGNYDQTYHKDSPLPWGTKGGMRSHRPNWAMVFYYPQKTSIEMGATEILPGTQYWNVDREGDGRTEGEDRLDPMISVRDTPQEELAESFSKTRKQLDRNQTALKLELPKGSLVLVHFDLFHRGTRRVVDEARFMYKFWYVRAVEPKRPSKLRRVRFESKDSRRQATVSAIANWMGIELSTTNEAECQTSNEQEADLLSCAFRLASEAPKELVANCLSGIEAKRRTSTYALVNQPDLAIECAIPLVESDNSNDRVCGSFLLGEVGSNHEQLEILVKCVMDSDLDVRLTAINSLGRFARRELAKPSHVNIESVLEELLATLDRATETTTRPGLVQSAERQCVFVSLLNIVSSAACLETKPPWAESLRNSLEWCSKEEVDRYARGTALEVLKRIDMLGS